MKKRKRNIFFIFSLFVFFFSLIILFLSRENPSFASSLNASLGAPIRSFLLILSNPVPFSLFEAILVLYTGVLALLLYFLHRRSNKGFFHRFLCFTGIFLLIFSLLISTVFVGYGVDIANLPENLSEDDFVFSLLYLKDRINSFDGTVFLEKDAMSEKIFSAYYRLSLPETYMTCVPPEIKAIKNERLASKLGILGSFSFLTSEISINFSAPEYTVVFSIAHEMAHLFGISGEAEASFYAYLAANETGDSDIIYSVSLSAFEFLAQDLSRINPEKYKEIYLSLSDVAKSDLSKYRKFYNENRSSVSICTEKTNEALLEFVDHSGEKSYSAVTKLLVSYLTADKLCN